MLLVASILLAASPPPPPFFGGGDEPAPRWGWEAQFAPEGPALLPTIDGVLLGSGGGAGNAACGVPPLLMTIFGDLRMLAYNAVEAAADATAAASTAL